MKLVSACLVGICATYKGGAHPRGQLIEMVRRGEAVPICPEQVGGLSTPRPPAEIVGGTAQDVLNGVARVVTRDGVDVTDNYLRGAHETLRLAQSLGGGMVILKERSPSCGVESVYDGTHLGHLIAGCGVTTALLRQAGIAVVSDESLEAGAATKR